MIELDLCIEGHVILSKQSRAAVAVYILMVLAVKIVSLSIVVTVLHCFNTRSVSLYLCHMCFEESLPRCESMATSSDSRRPMNWFRSKLG